jgi:hypothetical protein
MNKTNIFIVAIIFFSYFSLLIGFYLNEDGSGTPLSGDFRDTWPYVVELTKEIFIDPTPWTLHFPMHYFLLSRLYLIVEDINIVRFLFFIVALITPFLFFTCLKEYLRKSDKIAITFISLTLLFTPSFRYSAIWANDQITFYILVFLGTFFYLRSKKSNIIPAKDINIYLYLVCFAAACYSRQFYSLLYALFLINILINYGTKTFIYFSSISAVLAMPGLAFVLKYPQIFGNLVFSGNIFNTLFGNISAILIYTFPIFFLNFYLIKQIEKKIFIFKLMISIIFFTLIYFLSDTNLMNMNGGLFFFFSKKIFGNLLPFYVSFILSFFIILCLFKGRDFLILIIIILMIAGIIVLPKYLEPLILIFFFLYSSSEYKYIFLYKPKISFLLFGYYVIYYAVSVSDFLYLF